MGGAWGCMGAPGSSPRVARIDSLIGAWPGPHHIDYTLGDARADWYAHRAPVRLTHSISMLHQDHQVRSNCLDLGIPQRGE